MWSGTWGIQGGGQREERTKEGGGGKTGRAMNPSGRRLSAPAEGEQAERGLYCIWQGRAAGMPACP